MYFRSLSIIILCTLFGCHTQPTNISSTTEDTINFTITNLTTDQYPDNPDIGFWATSYQETYFEDGTIRNEEGFIHTFTFYSQFDDTITFQDLDISELIPTIPTSLKKQDYLSFISCINQEWNRNQIRFTPSYFSSTDPSVHRVDIARNCLQSYLWEIILYTQEGDTEKAYAHGWFSFPKGMYERLFEEKNEMPFETYRDYLITWKDPASEKIDLNSLRTVTDQLKVRYSDQSDKMYPISGARKKKFKEIIYPDTFRTMRDLQSDSSRFATFTPPGFYNKKDPRKTQLGRIFSLDSLQLYKTISRLNQDTVYELQFHFHHRSSETITKLVLGGLHFDDFPVLPIEKANNGWKNSMGIANHSFYEDYASHLLHKTDQSAYYALLLDQDDQWLDSHMIGIDGPIIHFSDPERTKLEIWLLSFERHALVGHYTIYLN